MFVINTQSKSKETEEIEKNRNRKKKLKIGLEKNTGFTFEILKFTDYF